MNMKNRITVICFWGLTALILIYLAISIIPSLFRSESIRVEAARSIQYDDALTVRGIALRDEVLVTVSGTPSSVDYKVADGDRVSRGDEVAVYNSSGVSASDRVAVELIDRRIALLSESVSATSQYDLKTLDAKTKDAVSLYLDSTKENNLSVSRKTSEQVLSCMIKQDIKVNGDKEYFDQMLENCKSEKSAILNGNTSKQTVVKSPWAGYFSSRYDGYEGLTATEVLENGQPLSPKSVHTLLDSTPQPRPSNYVGKLQHFSFWNFVCTVPESEAERFVPKSSWTIRFETASHGTRDVSMTVKEVSSPENGEIAILFECTFFDDAIFSLRITDAQIILRSYSGFRVRKDAIRVSDGQSGVYVLIGAKLVFKPVSVLYIGDDSDFAVVAPAVQNSSKTLLLNDSVVIGGKNIYDGKVVNIN